MNINDAYEYEEFKEVLNEFHDEYQFVHEVNKNEKNAVLRRNEREYWDIVEGKIGKF